jgi:hypothetical protein
VLILRGRAVSELSHNLSFGNAPRRLGSQSFSESARSGSCWVRDGFDAAVCPANEIPPDG